MKIFLTFILLLFSSSVVAGDDLTGQKILCIKIFEGVIIKGEDNIKLDVFEFIDDKIVENTFKYAGGKKTFGYFYEAQIRNIYIYLPQPDKSKRFLYKLNRENLTLTSIGKNTREIVYNKGSCNLIYDDFDLNSLIVIEEKFRQKIKSENQL